MVLTHTSPSFLARRLLVPVALLAAATSTSAAAAPPSGAAGATSAAAPAATAPPPSGAASSSAAAPAATADELFRDAGQAYDAGAFTLARALYERAFQQKQTHDIAAMLAQTEMKLGKPCQAEAHLAWAIANFPPSLTAERRARIQRAHTEVKKQLGALRLEVTPPGAAIQVDFEPVPAGALPGLLCAGAGERLVFASLDGFAVERRLVLVEPGAVVPLTLELRRLVPPAAAAPSSGPLPPAPGPRSITPAQPRVPPAAATPVAFSGLLIGVGGVLAGAVLLPFAFDRAAGADALEGELTANGSVGVCNAGSDAAARCAQLRSLRADQALFLNTGIWSLIAGASLGALSGGILLALPPAGGVRPGGPHVTVGGAPDSAFIAVEGAF